MHKREYKRERRAGEQEGKGGVEGMGVKNELKIACVPSFVIQ